MMNHAPDVHPVLFDELNAARIRSAALHTTGAAGPSGLDALTWRRLCTSFKSASQELCHCLALTAHRMCTTMVDPACLAPLLSSRLIALDKCPGVRPIGIGDTARCIIAKAILSITKQDIQEAVGFSQLCAGHIAGAEAGVHAVRSMFERNDTEALLLVDASNAFNSLNRAAALCNIQRLCPSIATALINIYRAPTNLYIDGDVQLSQEGTTQGDPLAMPMYALVTIPLIRKLKQKAENVDQVRYADDACGGAKIADLKQWWDCLNHLGPKFGYYTNASKTWLLTKREHRAKAEEVFAGTGVKITSDGRPYLGAPLGSEEYIASFLTDKVNEWTEEVDLLSSIAASQPHAAHAAFTHGMTSKWNYMSRTVPNISANLQPLERVIRTKLIPALTGRSTPNDLERDLLALPARLGGIGLTNPTLTSDMEYQASLLITRRLQDAVIQQAPQFLMEVPAYQLEAKREVHRLRREQAAQQAAELKETLPQPLQRAMLLAQEKGASSWLTTLPIEEFGFALHNYKRAFQDALALRYNWMPLECPSTCGCGEKFTVEHSLSCAKGGLPSIRHNEIRDLTANLLTEVCTNVCIEPDLQPLTGEVLSRATSNAPGRSSPGHSSKWLLGRAVSTYIL